jgi:hypothetical protein
MKYIQAARMAHAGRSVGEIAKAVDLPIGEIEFIAKVNQESLSFREEELPAWARAPEGYAPITPTSAPSQEPGVMFGVTPEVAVAPLATQPNHDALVERLSKLQFEMQNLDMELAANRGVPVVEPALGAVPPKEREETSLEKLGEKFRSAVAEAQEAKASSAEAVPFEAQADRLAKESMELEAARAAAKALAPKPVPVAAVSSGAVAPVKTTGVASGTASAPKAPVIRRVEFPRI